MTNRIVSVVIQLGVIVGAIVVLPYKVFELDRYFVPKELALHVVAVAAIVALLRHARDTAPDGADTLLGVFVLWSTLSALFATNHWIAQRSLGVSASGVLLFWAARRIGEDGRHRAIIRAGAIAAVCAALGGLAQTYGVDSSWFSLNRAPGGTFGNRNFVAHFCVIGLPALVYVTIAARGAVGAAAGSLAAAAVAALLVLSRSRGAWLGLGCSMSAMAVAFFVTRAVWRRTPAAGRMARLLLAAVVGVCAAIALPNRLNWNSDTPYLDSALGVVDYSSGSGRGRLIQYGNSMRMAIRHPVLGVGPGNWPVRYVPFATARDGSIASDGMTANPWPSSDWVALVSERGIIAAVALLGAFALLLLRGPPGGVSLDTDAALVRVTLLGTIVATLVTGAFDAVLILAAPSLLAWSVIGACAGATRQRAAARAAQAAQAAQAAPAVARAGRIWRGAIAVALLVALISLARSGAQVTSIFAVGTGWSRAQWDAGVRWDPGSYRINERVAEQYLSRGQCRAAREYALRAQSLFPNAGAPRRVLRRCRG